MTNKNSWYIKTAQGVTGPFPSGQIAQMVLLGRINLDDMVSHDKDKWVNIRNVDSLIPDVYKTADDDDLSKERIEAAKRWADERREERRNEVRADKGSRDGRRMSESDDERMHREKRERAYKNISRPRKLPFLQIVLLLIILVVSVYFSFLYSPDQKVASVDCNMAPGPSVNWKNCNKSGLIALKKDMRNSNLSSANLAGANLVGSNLSSVNASYVDFSRANLSYVVLAKAILKGANFRNADLRNANLDNADLQYANFKNSNIASASLKNADLSFAIWTDGKKCGAESVSVCKTTNQN